jgi:hypothetical protein
MSSPNPPPLALTDAQLDHLMKLSRPLVPAMRDVFLQLVERELRARVNGGVGDGEFYRLCKEIIKSNGLFDPPQDGNAMISKYG